MCPPPSRRASRLPLYLDKREIVALMTARHAPEGWLLGYLRITPHFALEEISSVQVDWERPPQPSSQRTQIDIATSGKRTVPSGCGPGHDVRHLMRNRADRPPEKLFSGRFKAVICFAKCASTSTHLQQAARCTARAVHNRVRDPDVRRDVGRPNAVDAIAGFMWLDAIAGSDRSSTPPAASPPRW